MPLGDVTLLELADAVRDRIESSIDYLDGHVRVVEANEDHEPIDVQKYLGSDRFGVRISYGNPALRGEPYFNSAMEFAMYIRCTVMFRKPGSMSTRMRSEAGRSVDSITKDVLSALEGQRLDILNRTGLSCSEVQYESQGSLQAMRFTVAARSRETRS